MAEWNRSGIRVFGDRFCPVCFDDFSKCVWYQTYAVHIFEELNGFRTEGVYLGEICKVDSPIFTHVVVALVDISLLDAIQGAD